MRGLMIPFCVFFAYIANSMIAHVDAAAYGVLLLDLLLRVQMNANPGKTRNSHLQQNQSYGIFSPLIKFYPIYRMIMND